MPPQPGPRPDQIQQPTGVNPGDIMVAGVNGPVFISPSTVSTGPTTRHITDISSIDDVTSIPTPDYSLINIIPISVYVSNETRGEKLKFIVPDDYNFGDIELLVCYKMSISDVNNVLLEAEIAIVDTVSGSLVINTGPQLINFNPIDSANFDRASILTISSGSFSPGDVIVINLKRLGDAVTDNHIGDWEVVAFTYRYET